MPQLSKSQYLNYRKVALLYVLFIGFYFLTSPEEILKHYRSVNRLLLNRLEYRGLLTDWSDSISGAMGYNDPDVLAIGRSERFGIVKYNADLALAINGTLESSDSIDQKFREALYGVFDKGVLPNETPNVISSTLLAAWELGKHKKTTGNSTDAEEAANEQSTFIELDQLIKFSSRSVYLLGEKLVLKWPSFLKDHLAVELLGFGSYVLSPGKELTLDLKRPGEFDFTISSGGKVAGRKIKVIKPSESQWYYRGNSRHLVLESGLSHLLAVQDLNGSQKSVSIRTSRKSVKAEMLENGQLRLESDPFFSGDVLVFFDDLKDDTLSISFVSRVQYGIKLYTPGRNVGDYLFASHVQLRKGIVSYAITEGSYRLYGKMGLIGKGLVIDGEMVGIEGFDKSSIQVIKFDELELVSETGQRLTIDNSLIYKVPSSYGKQ